VKVAREAAREVFGVESERGKVRWNCRVEAEAPQAVQVMRVCSTMVKRLSTKDGKVFKYVEI
jgi:hypothetical protein